MAVKRIRMTMDEQDQQKLKTELSIVMKNDNDFTYIVQFYGTLFREGDCWICMELMDTSLHELYKRVFGRRQRIPEEVLTQVAFSTVHALNYLKETLQMIHRDIKPSNILLNRKVRELRSFTESIHSIEVTNSLRQFIISMAMVSS